MASQLTNQSKGQHHDGPMTTQSQHRQPAWSAGKSERRTKFGMVLVLHTIGANGSARFLDQSQSEVKKNQTKIHDPFRFSVKDWPIFWHAMAAWLTFRLIILNSTLLVVLAHRAKERNRKHITRKQSAIICT